MVGWMDRWIDGWMDGWMDGWVGWWVDRRKNGLIDGRMGGRKPYLPHSSLC